MNRSIAHLGVQEAARREESEVLVTATRELSSLGCDSVQISHLFGNVSAFMAMKQGLSRRDFIALCLSIWAATEEQMGRLEGEDAGENDEDDGYELVTESDNGGPGRWGVS